MQSLITVLIPITIKEPPFSSAVLLMKVELVIVSTFPTRLIAPPSNFAEQLMNLQLLTDILFI